MKIHGQPTNQDIDHLDDELTAIASSFPSELGEDYMAIQGWGRELLIMNILYQGLSLLL